MRTKVWKTAAGEFDHLKDWIDVKEETKETLKQGLLAFLKKTEKKNKLLPPE